MRLLIFNVRYKDSGDGSGHSTNKNACILVFVLELNLWQTKSEERWYLRNVSNREKLNSGDENFKKNIYYGCKIKEV